MEDLNTYSSYVITKRAGLPGVPPENLHVFLLKRERKDGREGGRKEGKKESKFETLWILFRTICLS